MTRKMRGGRRTSKGRRRREDEKEEEGEEEEEMEEGGGGEDGGEEEEDNIRIAKLNFQLDDECDALEAIVTCGVDKDFEEIVFESSLAKVELREE